MADTPNTFSTLDGLFKEVYDDKILDLIPESSWLMKNTKFVNVGKNFNVPVLLTNEQGHTYSRPDNGAFALEESVAAVMKNAQVAPYQIVEKSTMSYEAAYRSEGGGKIAFTDGTKQLIQNMINSASKRAEIEYLYGQTGIGEVNAATVASTTFAISEASWSSAIWAGLENAKIAIWDAGFGASEDTDETIASINLDDATRTITVGNVQTLDAGDVIVFKGQVEAGPVYNSMVGLNKIATTTSGTLFGINVGTYSLFRGQQMDAAGQITMSKVMKAVTMAANRGCNEELAVLCNPDSFQTLNTDIAGLRRFDASYNKSKASLGSEAIEFYGATGAPVKIVPHIYVKKGDAFVVPMKQVIRVGSTELTFRRPVHGDIFRESDNAGFELRAYLAQSIFCRRPSWLVKIYGISNP